MSPAAPPSAPASVTEWFTPGRFLVLLAVLVASAYPWVLLGVETFYYRDYGVLAYPTIHHHRESFWRAEVPLWNSLSHCGVPFLAQWGTMVLYPLSLIYTVLPLPWALGLFCLGHLWFGGAGMCLLATRWTGDRFGAAVGGVAYAFGGLTLSSLMWPNWTAALGWLPWVIYCGDRAGKKGGYWLVHAGIAGTFQMMTGVPEVVLLTWFVVALLWVSMWIQAPGDWGRFFGRGALVVILVSTLSAAQLLPFLDLMAHSQRQGAFSDPRWSMPVWGWANLVVPLFHCFGTPQGTFAQHEQAFFTTYYPGLLVVLLSVAACRILQTARQRIVLGLLFLGSVLALGPQGYVYSWLKEFIPGLGLGRYPVKFFVLGAFAFPVLAAYAVASLRSNPVARNWRVIWACAAGLLVVGTVLLWMGRRHPFPFDQWDLATRNFCARAFWLLMGLGSLLFAMSAKSTGIRTLAGLAALVAIWVDLRSHWPAHNPTLSARVMTPGISEIDRESLPVGARIFIAPWAGEQLLRSNVPNPAQDLLGKRLAMWSNLNLLEGIANVGGAMTLRLRHQEDVQKRIEQTSGPMPVLDYLAVVFTTSSNNPVQWLSRTSALSWINAGPLPLFLEQGAESLKTLVSPDFDPGASIILPTEAAETSWPNAAGRTEVRIARAAPQYIQIMASADQPAVISIAQSFYHPWRATLDGNPAPLWRANHAFQAVQVPRGEHQVELRYVDRNFWIGGVISVISGALCCATLVRWRFVTGHAAIRTAAPTERG